MKTLRIAALLALGIASAGFIAPAVYADPPPWAPAHGWRAKHRYVYYPAAEVYYAPASRLWFWLGGDGWQAGVGLPLALQGYVRTGGIRIGLDVDRPYLRNDYVVHRYGGHEHRWWRHHDQHDHHSHSRGDRGDDGHQHGHHDD